MKNGFVLKMNKNKMLLNGAESNFKKDNDINKSKYTK